MDFTRFQALSFDCYGTLIDWESGICRALVPLMRRAGGERPRNAVLEAFAAQERKWEAVRPAIRYSELLSRVHEAIAEKWGVAPDRAEAERFGQSIGDWEPFPDTVDALRYLKRHFKLIILSNVDNASFRATNARLGVDFDAICTAEDIGAYKPDPANFAYLIEKAASLRVSREHLLHVAQSLYHDHVPAQAAGLASVWIDRRHDAQGWGATVAPPTDVRYDARFISLGDFAEAHRRLVPTV